ncbi:hypothetical protein EVJ29_02510 [Exiguobacterium sp. SH4S7]|uniref:hypothetical protein n=1 Tax=Exiguobacterium sp. SH4S7 TaxID=2510958 RepID=UPI00103EA1CD|nr:hypothetical protein [Exiguobacterium sp. SH4S7]TCI39533.1 hypothetical protein EVJ29_02510 [Exiguobacterium sp. SH4S7]
MWWRDDTDQDEAEFLYKHILELEARIAKLVAHQVRVRRLLMQESSEAATEQIITLQGEVDHYLKLLRQERIEEVDRYDRLNLERTLGRVRKAVQYPTRPLSEWDTIEQALALEVEHLRRVLAYEQQRRTEEGW